MQRVPPNFLQRGLFVAAFNTALAALVTLFSPFGFLQTLVYAQCIGLSTWMLIDGAMLWRLRTGGMPRGHEAAAAVVAGMAGGYLLGSMLGDRLTGLSTAGVWTASPITGLRFLAVSTLASLTVALLFIGRTYLSNARAQAEAARRLAAEAQLRLLQSQLEPHMLFNTLANLRVLIGLDAAAAQAMLDRLIAFLRATLAASRLDHHPLSAEFARLSDYLALMQVRMGTRLQVRLDLPAALADLPVPPLLLQPLVENAIHHGLEPARGGGRLEVQARRERQRLLLSVCDSGCGLPAAAPAAGTGLGFGLVQIRERLAVLYGDAARLSLANRDDGPGTRALIELPLAPSTQTAP